MKIAVFIKSTTFHKNHGGLEIQNRVVCEELVKRGHEVVVFSPRGDVDTKEKDQNGVRYVFIKSDYKNYLFASMNPESWYKKSLETFSKLNDDNSFDIVLSQSASGESIIENKKLLGVKTISIAHGTTSSEYLTFLKNITNPKDIYWLIRNTQYFLRQYFGRQRRYILHADRVISVSNYVKKALISETFVSEDRVRVIHNGIDGSVFENIPSNKCAGITSLYFIGRVERSKGILTILNILKDVKKDFIFHVVGDGPCLEEAKSKAKINCIAEKVVFHGRVSQHSAFLEKVHSDIFVFPTQRIEGFPMVLVESMFAGIPVVAFDCGGVSDAVEDGKTGYLIKAGDAEDFKKKLEKLIDDENMRLEFGKNSKEKAEKEFTIDKIIDKYEEVFNEVLE